MSKKPLDFTISLDDYVDKATLYYIVRNRLECIDLDDLTEEELLEVKVDLADILIKYVKETEIKRNT